MEQVSDLNLHYGAQGKFPDIRQGTFLSKIVQSIFNSYAPFLAAVETHQSQDLHTEKSLVQEFVIQNDIQLRKLLPNVRIEKEYTDNFFHTKGISDFAFLPLEEGESLKPYFVVEAKLLPAPEASREKEYVMGKKENGGMERFKLGKHGVGLSCCGLLGFMTSHNEGYWVKRINGWILEFSKTCPEFWSEHETLKNEVGDLPVYSYAVRKNGQVMLYHFFVDISAIPYFRDALCKRCDPSERE